MCHRTFAIGVLAIAVISGGHASVSATSGAAQRFLSTYVTRDGRVIRYDQGGDIVSEGQAYGVLIAELAGRSDVARRIWQWTEAHLALANGLLAWHANQQGVPESNQSAADADVLMAFGLLRYQGVGSSSMHSAGRALATAVLKNEAVMLKGGAPLVVAGPWATSGSVVDPSYLMPGVFDEIGRLSGDHAWSRAATVSVDLVAGLTEDGNRLPPDWAVLKNHALTATPPPGQGGSARYGFDAVRLPIWFASSCDPRARRLAAALWHNVFSKQADPGVLPLALDGSAENAAPNPVSLMSASAAAAADGDASRAAALRSQAQSLARRNPTYYGDAWVAIGDALSQGSLSGCAP